MAAGDLALCPPHTCSPRELIDAKYRKLELIRGYKAALDADLALVLASLCIDDPRSKSSSSSSLTSKQSTPAVRSVGNKSSPAGANVAAARSPPSTLNPSTISHVSPSRAAATKSPTSSSISSGQIVDGTDLLFTMSEIEQGDLDAATQASG